MDEVIKNTLSSIDIYDYTGEDYKKVMNFENWRIAYLNFGTEFNDKTLPRLERHMESDEVFVLLEGEATLIIGKEIEKIPMETHKVYNVPKGVWHHVMPCENARMLIVENDDTGKSNTEYIYFEK